MPMVKDIKQDIILSSNKHWSKTIEIYFIYKELKTNKKIIKAIENVKK